MVQLDLIGVFITIFLAGPRYFFYVIIGSFLAEFARLAAAIILDAKIKWVVIGGFFGMVKADSSLKALILFAGPIFCWIIGMVFNRGKKNSFSDLFDLYGALKNPFAIVMMRMSLVLTLISAWIVIKDVI